MLGGALTVALIWVGFGVASFPAWMPKHRARYDERWERDPNNVGVGLPVFAAKVFLQYKVFGALFVGFLVAAALVEFG